jgi:hypothetical protein
MSGSGTPSLQLEALDRGQRPDSAVISVLAVQVVKVRPRGLPERRLSVRVGGMGAYVFVVDADVVEVALMRAGPPGDR